MDTKQLTAILAGYGLVAGLAIGGGVLEEEQIVFEDEKEVIEEVKPIEEVKEPIISFSTKDSTILATKENIIEAIHNDEEFKIKVAEAFVSDSGELDGAKILGDRDIFNAVLNQKIQDQGGSITINTEDMNEVVLNLLTN